MCHIDLMARSDRDDRLPVKPTRVELAREEDLPVVARMVVEIRSDGRRTIARGAMEDVGTGQGMAIEARGDSPIKLAMSLARAMFSLPAIGRGAARALLRGRRKG
jgi:hypothetical protein